MIKFNEFGIVPAAESDPIIDTPTGIFYDIPFSEYLKIPAISKSTLFNANKCERWFLHSLEEKTRDDKEPEKAHFSLGRAVHTKVFEPDLFDAQFTVIPKIDRRTKKGKQEYADFIAQSVKDGKSIITDAEMEQVDGMAESLSNHPRAMSLLSGGQSEVTIVNRCPWSGVIRKVRLDWLVDNNLISDLKTTGRLASEDAVIKQIYDLGYYLQAGMYTDVASCELGHKVKDFIFIFIETTAPYLIGLYHVDPKLIILGQSQYRHLLSKVMHCVNSNEWPHYNDNQIVKVNLKPWMINQIQEQFEDSF